jgi:hypothetical protein
MQRSTISQFFTLENPLSQFQFARSSYVASSYVRLFFLRSCLVNVAYVARIVYGCSRFVHINFSVTIISLG